MESTKNIMMLPDERLEELSKDPTNIVYRFKGGEQLDPSEIVPVEEVKNKIQRLYADYCSERQHFIDKKQPINKTKWNKIRSNLLQYSEWKDFDRTHPLIFDRVTHPATTNKEIKALLYMIFLKSTNVPNGQEALQNYVMKEFAQTPQEYQAWKEKEGYK